MVWTALDVLRLAIVALADEEPEGGTAPAAYLYGHTPDNETSLIKKGSELYNQEQIKEILICGGGPYRAPGKPEAPIAYSGEHIWRHLLVRECVQQKDITSIARPELSHTGTEAERLILYAKTQAWSDIFIVALPIHMPRAFANTVTQALRLYPSLRIWCKPGAVLPYADEAVSSQGMVLGARLIQGIEAEFERWNAIWNNPLDIAPPEPIIEYLLTRRER